MTSPCKILFDEGLHAWMTPQDTARRLFINPIDLFGMKDVQDQGHTRNHNLSYASDVGFEPKDVSTI